MPTEIKDKSYGWSTHRIEIVYPVLEDLAASIEYTDLDYDNFIEENSRIFQAWRGALTHTELCRLDILTRYKYLKQLIRQIEEMKEKNKELEELNASK